MSPDSLFPLRLEKKKRQAGSVQRDHYGGGSVKQWAGIYHDWKTNLVTVQGNLTAQRYCDEIIQPVVVSSLQQLNTGIFQHDNISQHTTTYYQNVLLINHVNVL